MVKVLFVCLGNICRSPTAQGVFAQVVEEAGLSDVIQIDSAGTASYHLGEPPDARSQKAALSRGVDISGLRARQVRPGDCCDYDYILAMDRSNLNRLQNLCSGAQQNHIQLFLDYAPHLEERDVPDPYYGGGHGFQRVLDLVDEAARGLLKHIRTHDLTA